jgi:phosphopantothenoylcysteine decarboxylase/phosphopantothenate--cysteine ligase
MLAGKKILLGVCGSIAAYKAAFLTRLLVKQGAEVKIILTQSAAGFITPLTLATLSKNPVLTEFQVDSTGVWNNHVDLGLWADVMLIAPASAGTLAKCANGLCDNLLTAVYLSARCPVMFAPAMDLDMYQHPATRQNLQNLQSFGNQLIASEFGELASGLVGEGRMAEPENIVAFLAAFFEKDQVFAGKTILITAGPTQEAIDPVRFISNHSTGKMGYAIAEAFARQGAKVILVSGATNLSISHPRIHRVNVLSAQEMYEAAATHFPTAHITVLAAAVADYTPEVKAAQKIKKKEGENTMTIELVKTTDIARTLGSQKRTDQQIIGFALETENELDNARQKLEKKNFDWIVLNSLNDAGAGFGYDTNKITVLDKSGNITQFPLADKKALALEIVKLVG